ncbi:hypothetical protein E2C01_068012 [Portunus trituberculatus]|uniref:Uncharacterized protein n=1 Tax=Portunus trituberculatus TaxID=210409 RepID=A0A5B7HWS1_PORTR|nr:hypothetical protein [Portunus trituberculatus]
MVHVTEWSCYESAPFLKMLFADRPRVLLAASKPPSIPLPGRVWHRRACRPVSFVLPRQNRGGACRASVKQSPAMKPDPCDVRGPKLPRRGSPAGPRSLRLVQVEVLSHRPALGGSMPTPPPAARDTNAPPRTRRRQNNKGEEHSPSASINLPLPLTPEGFEPAEREHSTRGTSPHTSRPHAGKQPSSLATTARRRPQVTEIAKSSKRKVNTIVPGHNTTTTTTTLLWHHHHHDTVLGHHHAI